MFVFMRMCVSVREGESGAGRGVGDKSGLLHTCLLILPMAELMESNAIAPPTPKTTWSYTPPGLTMNNLLLPVCVCACVCVFFDVFRSNDIIYP